MMLKRSLNCEHTNHVPLFVGQVGQNMAQLTRIVVFMLMIKIARVPTSDVAYFVIDLYQNCDFVAMFEPR